MIRQSIIIENIHTYINIISYTYFARHYSGLRSSTVANCLKYTPIFQLHLIHNINLYKSKTDEIINPNLSNWSKAVYIKSYIYHIHI